jgi:hypothetical protein
VSLSLGDRRSNVFLLALLTWAIGAPIGVSVVAEWTGREGLVPCPICGSHGISCRHRALAQVTLHLAGIVGILWRWWRSDPESEVPPPPRLRRSKLALAQTAFMVVALVLEVDEVRSVVWTGILLALLGCLLVTPAAALGARIAGVAGLLTALLGFYAIVLLGLGPHDAEVPLFVLGCFGTLISAIGSVVAIKSDRAT